MTAAFEGDCKALAQGLTEGAPVALHAGVGSTAPLFAKLAREPLWLLITTEGMVRRGTVASLLGASPLCLVRTIGSNPELDAIDAIREAMSRGSIEHVVGLGGGSALDTAKLLSFLLAKENAGLTLSRLLREAAPFQAVKLPLTLIPTTSGTGSETTPYACVWDRSGKGKYKYTFANPALYATESYLDPNLTVTVPRAATINAALDTCSHAMETLWNKNATPASIAFANQALAIWVQALPCVLANLQDRDARMAMQWASVAAGRAISISKTAIAHSISYPVTYHYGVPHGLACSFALKRLAERVEAKEAWMPGTKTSLLKEVMALFDTLDTQTALSAYCSFEEVCDHASEMFTPGRSDSFVLAEDEVRAIFTVKTP